jgi:hypothetical protein
MPKWVIAVNDTDGRNTALLNIMTIFAIPYKAIFCPK